VPDVHNYLDYLDDDFDPESIERDGKRLEKPPRNPMKEARQKHEKAWGRDLAKFQRTDMRTDRIR
jgi:hypothetical protein